jgi:hypothetical protein
MRRMLVFLLLSASLGFTSAGAQIPLGATAPNFTTTRLGGGSVSLSDHAGKVVVLFLFGWA